MRYLIVVIAVCSSHLVSAQSYPDELMRYSLTEIGGTARSIGAGNAFSSVGADLSCAATNPAGLGLYRSAEISGSLGLFAGRNKSEFFNSSFTSDKVSFYVPHLGGVFTLPLKNKGKKTNFIQFGLTYQRLADFSRTREYDGLNNYNSIVDGYFDEIMSSNAEINYENFSPGAVQAWNTYLIDYDSTYGEYFKRVYAPVYQRGYITERGGANEINFTVSGNINDIVYVGGAIGIPWINYERRAQHGEYINYNDSLFGFRNFTQTERYNVSGAGVNFKLGIIVKPVDFWRIGASFQTPTVMMSMEETHEIDMQSGLVNIDDENIDIEAPTYVAAPFSFRYNRPLKATFGTSFFIKQYGFISVDYELNDYTHSTLKFDNAYRDAQESYNNEIKALYGIGHTLRVGAEFAWNVLRIRAGYNYNTSPFKKGMAVEKYDWTRHTATCGLGYRGKIFFADIAYARTMGKDYQSIYSTKENEPALKSSFNTNRVVVTVGFKIGGKKNY